MVKLTSAQQKLVPVRQKLKRDNNFSCVMLEGTGSHYITHLPTTIPLVMEHSIKQGCITDDNLITAMEKYHPIAGVWATATQFKLNSSQGKNKVKKLRKTITPHQIPKQHIPTQHWQQ
eukprot:556535-Ditylum_brightwellii.AAC.1